VPPPWAVDEVQRRIVLLLNHILQQEPEAQARLARQKGRIVHVQWRSVAITLIATPVGLLDLAPAQAHADLNLSLTEPSALALVQQLMRGDKPAVRVEGDVQLAAEVNWLADHVRWDLEEDLARLLGDVPAHVLADGVRSLVRGLRGFVGARADGGTASRQQHDSPVSGGLHRLRIALRYGLDELVLDQFPETLAAGCWRRVLSVGRRPGCAHAGSVCGRPLSGWGRSLSSSARCCLPGETCCRWILPTSWRGCRIGCRPLTAQWRSPPSSARSTSRWTEVFVSFEREPVASASIAQVHVRRAQTVTAASATWRSRCCGRACCQLIEKDLALMRMMAGCGDGSVSDGRRLKPREVVAEFDKYLHDELDLVREASSAAQLRRNMAGLDPVLIPRNATGTTAPTEVIVMERMVGRFRSAR